MMFKSTAEVDKREGYMASKRSFVAGVFFGLLALILAGGLANGQRSSAADTIVELPVSFHVVNTNTSGAACPSDGLAYVVQGHLVGPQSIIYGPAPRAITVYVHGHSGSEG